MDDIRGYRDPETELVYCRVHAEEGHKNWVVPIKDGIVHECCVCFRNAAYPLWREYKLYELDNGNCLLITGFDCKQLRIEASNFFNHDPFSTSQDQNSPLWDAVMHLQARDVWEYREKIRQRQTKVFQILVDGWNNV